MIAPRCAARKAALAALADHCKTEQIERTIDVDCDYVRVLAVGTLVAVQIGTSG